MTVISRPHPNDPLHGVTLEAILTQLVEHYGWEKMGSMITIRCFNFDPSIKSSLTFLRKTPWARQKVEKLYIKTMRGRKFVRPTHPEMSPVVQGEIVGRPLKKIKKPTKASL